MTIDLEARFAAVQRPGPVEQVVALMRASLEQRAADQSARNLPYGEHHIDFDAALGFKQMLLKRIS